MNADETLFLPAAAGSRKQQGLWDGTYTLNDLLDILEVIQVKNETTEGPPKRPEHIDLPEIKPAHRKLR